MDLDVGTILLIEHIAKIATATKSTHEQDSFGRSPRGIPNLLYLVIDKALHGTQRMLVEKHLDRVPAL